jgi:hypothetical protein
MKKLGKVFWVLACISAFSRTVCAQLSEIDPAKLPHDAAVQSAYVQLLPIEHYGQSWTNDWKYDVPKKVVVDQFTTALSQLVTASERSPDNHELQLLTGLVAHFAYNLDVDSSWATAVNSLQKAAASDPKDYRASWFLGMHQCQATDNGPGMTHLLGGRGLGALAEVADRFLE